MQDFYMPYETTASLIEKGLIQDLLAEKPENEAPMAETTTEEPTAKVEETIEEPTVETEETVEEAIGEEAMEMLQEIAATKEPEITKANVDMVFGIACVFKPYYDGCDKDDVLKLPVTKQRFESFKERKQIKIFKNAEKKREKEQAKQKKMEQRLLKKQEKVSKK